MNRLLSELHRLYLPEPPDDRAQPGATPALVTPDGRVRALVLALSGPADWSVIARVWRGVQLDLELPAPAIAVSGSDALQLWFSLEQPIGTAEAQGLLAALRNRYLADIAPRRLRLLPAAEASPAQPDSHARLVPAPQVIRDHWSAFVAPDLAPVFADTPWLDIPPSDDGQAELLSALQRIKPAAFAAALAQLQPAAAEPPPAASSGADDEPRQFLLRVMRDERIDLALRIEAAKALLR